IRTGIAELCRLRFEESELAYLRGLRFMKSDFVDFLALFQFNEKYIHIERRADQGIDIAIRGPWLHTILYEIPVLAIVSEVYFRRTQPNPDLAEGRRRNVERAAGDEARCHAARHDGARVHAGVPGARPKAARRAGLRVRQVGAGVSRRP